MGWKIVLIVLVSFLVMPEGIAKKKNKRSKRIKGEYVIETRADGTKVKYKRKNVYDFEGADIEGLFKRPSGSYISNLRNVKGKSIIRIRRDFDNEVIDSVRLLK